MLTDALSKGGLNVPKLEGEVVEELKAQLFPGAAVGNPIDILATGTQMCIRDRPDTGMERRNIS